MTGSVIEGRARPLGNYPHVKCVGDFIFVSGTTARLPDGSVAGVTKSADGRVVRDAAEQTRIVIENIRNTLTSVGVQLSDCVDMVVFLTDMNDFAAYNKVYGEYFDIAGPTRTTVGISALPHADMVVEMKAVAYRPQK
jgi:2-aminomuconate deaminase